MTEAAVLVPLFRDEDGVLRLVLVVRGEVGMHGGQVSLPGGKRESHDASPLATALRETEEEIGLTPDEIDVIASLEVLEARTTRFRIYPFLAHVRKPSRLQLGSDEVVEILTPSVECLADPARRTATVRTFPSWPEPRRVDQVTIGDGYAVWGVTLRLVNAVLPRILAGEWQL